jgi:DNA-binding NarL/FixJ family response regulator
MEIPIQEVQHILHRKQIITLYEEGLKKAEIARRLGITERVVKYAVKRHLTGM